jgi:hypothetical protein
MVQTVGWFGINPFVGVVANTTANIVTNLEFTSSVFPAGPATPDIRAASGGTGLRYYLSAKWTA